MKLRQPMKDADGLTAWFGLARTDICRRVACPFIVAGDIVREVKMPRYGVKRAKAGKATYGIAVTNGLRGQPVWIRVQGPALTRVNV